LRCGGTGKTLPPLGDRRRRGPRRSPACHGRRSHEMGMTARFVAWPHARAVTEIRASSPTDHTLRRRVTRDHERE
jgi:hypothetical protein